MEIAEERSIQSHRFTRPYHIPEMLPAKFDGCKSKRKLRIIRVGGFHYHSGRVTGPLNLSNYENFLNIYFLAAMDVFRSGSRSR